MIGNPLLDDDSAGGKFDCILIDEAHERTTANDTLLQNVRYMCERRPDVKVIVMSATIDLEWYARYFEGLKVDTVYVPAPPTYPRILKYPSQPLPTLDNKVVEDAVVDAILRAARRTERITRHKMNPNCPTMGDREGLVRQGALTNTLPKV